MKLHLCFWIESALNLQHGLFNLRAPPHSDANRNDCGWSAWYRRLLRLLWWLAAVLTARIVTYRLPSTQTSLFECTVSPHLTSWMLLFAARCLWARESETVRCSKVGLPIHEQPSEKHKHSACLAARHGCEPKRSVCLPGKVNCWQSAHPLQQHRHTCIRVKMLNMLQVSGLSHTVGSVSSLHANRKQTGRRFLSRAPKNNYL